jgi:Mn2+/Fe2+ NRAMP family transporter
MDLCHQPAFLPRSVVFRFSVAPGYRSRKSGAPLVFAAYIASAFLAHPDWGSVLRATVSPKISLNSAYVQAALAILGTTLTSYAYIWEEQEEAEKKSPLGSLGSAHTGAGIGMVLAVAIFWFILVTTGATLGVHHKEVQTAEQAAAALKPVAGPLASYLFAIGLFASSFIAVPVLAATSGYLLCQEFGWRGGLSQKIRRARHFYAMVGATILVGVVISFAGVSPIKLLFVASIAGGLGTPIGLVFLLKVARDQRVMRRHRTGNVLMVIGWGTMLLVSAVSVYFIGQLLLSKLFGH